MVATTPRSDRIATENDPVVPGRWGHSRTRSIEERRVLWCTALHQRSIWGNRPTGRSVHPHPRPFRRPLCSHTRRLVALRPSEDGQRRDVDPEHAATLTRSHRPSIRTRRSKWACRPRTRRRTQAMCQSRGLRSTTSKSTGWPYSLGSHYIPWRRSLRKPNAGSWKDLSFEATSSMKRGGVAGD